MSEKPKRGRGRPKRPRIERGISRDTSNVPGHGLVAHDPQSTSHYSERPASLASRASMPIENDVGVAAAGPPGFKTDHGILPRAPPGKVAIPYIKTQAPESSRGSKKGRISHACDYCRKAKAGCSGEQPCSRCSSAGVSCFYGDGKRDKDRK